MRRLMWSLLAVPPAVGLALAFLPSAPGAHGAHGAPVRATLDARAAAAAQAQLRHLVFSRPGNQPVPGHTQITPDLTQQDSFNWSGYADDNTAANTYSKVTGNWAEPAVTCSKQDQIAVFWVGLDGYASNTAEQAGTLAQCFQGTAHYYTWWQMPSKSSPVEVGTTVKPGDKISAAVSVTGTQYTLKVTDSTTTGNNLSVQQSCGATTCPDASAEWITEAPFGTRGDYPLPNFKTWSLTAATVTSGTTSGAISSFPDDEITMLDGTETYNLAVPDALNKSGKAFTVAWANSY